MRTLLETAPFPFLEPWEQVLILSWLLILSYYSVKHDTRDCYPLMLYLMDFCSKKTLQTFLGFFLKPTTGGLNPQVPQTIDDLVTPCYIGYLSVIQRNCERMLQRAHSLGCQLRPHMKTHKTIQGPWDKEGGNWWDVCFVKRGRVMSLEIWLIYQSVPAFFLLRFDMTMSILIWVHLAILTKKSPKIRQAKFVAPFSWPPPERWHFSYGW